MVAADPAPLQTRQQTSVNAENIRDGELTTCEGQVRRDVGASSDDVRAKVPGLWDGREGGACGVGEAATTQSRRWSSAALFRVGNATGGIVEEGFWDERGCCGVRAMRAPRNRERRAHLEIHRNSLHMKLRY